MNISLPYGKTQLTLDLPDHLSVDVLHPHKTPAAPDPSAEVAAALNSVDWLQYKGARTAAIAINDKTRPVPHDLLLPPLLERLEQLGIPPERITLIVATGNHSPMMPNEFSSILPEAIIDRYRVISHDIDADHNIVRLGMSTRRTIVSINRTFFEANLRIALGNVEPHQFAGFSGGVKSAVIGLAGWDTINSNHRMMSAEGATLGSYEDNPVRQDIEDMGRIVGVHLALNTVMNDQKQIVRVFCGAPLNVMRAAIPLVRQVYQQMVEQPYDLIIASPGGHPKDINIYQAQKALGHAVLASRVGGTIILAAACSEGSGSAKYEHWIGELRLPLGADANRVVIERFRAEGFRVGPHKAFQIARDSVDRRVIWVTDLPNPAAFAFRSASSLRAALYEALDADPSIQRVAVLPYANATIVTAKP
ncbi:MAG: nickel-dependent lactate racemase [Chloroflexi bacterium CFX4]|nr:nickel-dependent lactate racemase [Chloroflexi bacterium CFX4]MDL1921159.1 nickel-dependent lactate racemase [Chloroflexi bacterium CFX3]